MLTYNALDYTKKCVNSILKNTSFPYEIIFIDNASTDGSVKYLDQICNEFDHLSLVKNNTNRGFAAGNNQGVKEAKGKYVLLLNNDIE